MKKQLASFSLLLVILFLASCSSSFQLEKRHYRNGFYIDRNAKRTNAAESFSPPTVVHAGAFISQTKPSPQANACNTKHTLDSLAKKTNAISSRVKISPIINKRLKNLKHYGRLLKKGAGNPDDVDWDEVRRCNRAAVLAAIALFLALTSIAAIFLLGVGGLLGAAVALLFAVAFALAGFFTALRVKKAHGVNDNYQGKKAVAFASVIGTITIFLLAFILVGVVVSRL